MLSTQAPAWHCCVFVQAAHVAPFTPHVWAFDVWHMLLLSQQPVQLDASQLVGLLHESAPNNPAVATASTASRPVFMDPP
jgi:hypothetical protein